MRSPKADRTEQTAWLLLSLHFRANIFEAQHTENSFSQETEETTVRSRQMGFSPGKKDVINISIQNQLRNMKGCGLIFASAKTKEENVYAEGPTNSSRADFRYKYKCLNECSDICLQTSQYDKNV